MKTIEQQLQEQLAYSTVVAHHLADALIYIDTLHEKIESCGDVVEDVIFEGLPETEFCYEEAAKAAVQSEEDALRGVKADAILSTLRQSYEFEPESFHSDVIATALIECYAEQVREGVCNGSS